MNTSSSSNSDSSSRNKKISTREKKSSARLAAVQALYQISYNKGSLHKVIDEFIHFRRGEDYGDFQNVNFHTEFFKELVSEVCDRDNDLNEILKTCLSSEIQTYHLGELFLIAIKVATYELMTHKDIPAPVIISEYMKIIQMLYPHNEVKLANAVLDKVKNYIQSQNL